MNIDIISSASKKYIGRGLEIKAAVCGFITGLPVLFIGRPGTAKSAIVRDLAESSGLSFGYRLLGRESRMADIWGPLSIKGLQQDTYERCWDAGLQRAEIVFLDEIFKAPAGVLDSLLLALNEKEYVEGAEVWELPWKAVFAASNEWPSTQFDAILDRFAIRVEIGYLNETSARLLVHASITGGLNIELPEWTPAQPEKWPTLDQSLAVEYVNLVSCLPISDRRKVTFARLVAAVAFVNGRQHVVKEDIMEAVAMGGWNRPNERDQAIAKAMAILNGQVVVTALKDRAKEIVKSPPTEETKQDAARILSFLTAYKVPCPELEAWLAGL